jgi:hypothetical protein
MLVALQRILYSRRFRNQATSSVGPINSTIVRLCIYVCPPRRLGVIDVVGWRNFQDGAVNVMLYVQFVPQGEGQLAS